MPTGDPTPTDHSAPHEPEFAVVPLSPPRPARFEEWHDDVKSRCYELWASIASRDATRTITLLARELGDEAPLPHPSTVRRWAINGSWSSRADGDLQQSHGRTLYELQVNWLS